MAQRDFFVDIDLNQNEILFGVLHSVATAPSSGSEVSGQLYYDTVANQPYYYNGSTWVSMSSASASSVPFSGVESATNTGQTLILGSGSSFLINGGSLQLQGASSGIMTLGTNLTGVTNRTINLPNIAATSTILATSESPSTGHFAKQSAGASGTITFAAIQNSDITGLLALDDLTDVVITTPANPSYLRYNGTSWVDVTAATVASDIGSSVDHGTLSGLTDDDHDQYIYDTPSTTRTNIITPSNNQTPLILRGPTSTADLFLITNNAGSSELFVIDSNSDIYFAGDQIFFNHDDGTDGGYIQIGRSSTGLGGYVNLSTTGTGLGGRIIANTNGAQDAGFLTMNSNGDSRGGNIDLGAAIGTSTERSGQWTSTAGAGGRGGDLIMDGSNANAGDIDTSGGSSSATGGSILTYGGFAASGSPTLRGGEIWTFGSNSTSGNTRGGDIKTNSVAGSGNRGGDILAQSGSGGAGGDINTSGGASAAGGSITTSNGGGSINTNTGTIQLGVLGNRTTLLRTSGGNYTTTFIGQTGSVPVFSSAPGSADLFVLSDNTLGGIKFATRAISNLSDVDTTGALNGNLLQYDGSEWVPVSASTVGVTDHGGLSGLTDDDHTQYVINTPGNSSRNTIDPSVNDATSLTITSATNSGSATFDIFVVESSANSSLFTVDDTSGSYYARFSSSLTGVQSSVDVSLLDSSLILVNGSSQSISIVPPAVLSSYTLTLPQNDGNSGQFLQTNGSGTTSWETALTSVSLDDLTDVVITTPANPSYLRYNGASWIDVTAATVANDLESSIDHGSIAGLTDDDHAQYIIDTPTSGTRNVIDPSTNDIASLTVQAAPNSGVATYSYFLVENSSAAELFSIGSSSGNEVANFASNLDSVLISAPATLNSVNLLFTRASQTITVAIPGSGVTGYTFTLPPTAGSNGNVLKTNGSGTTSWGTLALGDLSDVDLAGLSTNDLLQYNGADWVAISPSTVGVTDHGGLSGLTDDDHTQYLIKTPSGTTRNQVTGSSGQAVIIHGTQGSGGVYTATEGNSIFLLETSGSEDYLRFNATNDTAMMMQLNATNFQLHNNTPIVFKAGTTAAAAGVSLRANGTISSSYTITLPGAGPSASGNILYNTGSGTMAWGSHDNLSGLTSGDAHTQYILGSPTTSTRNIITAANATTIPLSVRAHASQSVDIFVVEANGGTNYLTIDSSGDATFSQDLIVTGNLTVNGTTTTINTTELTVEDNIIIVNSAGVVQNAGLEVERGANPNASIFYNESSDEWFVNNASVSLQIARKYVDTSTIVGDGSETSFAITHNIGSSDIVAAIYDSSDNQVEVEIVITNSNTLTVNFNSPVPNLTAYKAVIIG